MTKWRAPSSVDAALARIVGQLPGGWDQAAALVERRERTVRNWGEPDTPESIPLDCALKLDVAFQAAGGEGAPLYEAYGVRLKDAQLASFARAYDLGRLAAVAARECGEGVAAAVLAAQPGADPADRREALREADEGYEAIRLLRATLAEQVKADAGAGQLGPPEPHATGPPL